jgi:hypothetical protein
VTLCSPCRRSPATAFVGPHVLFLNLIPQAGLSLSKPQAHKEPLIALAPLLPLVCLPRPFCVCLFRAPLFLTQEKRRRQEGEEATLAPPFTT